MKETAGQGGFQGTSNSITNDTQCTDIYVESQDVTLLRVQFLIEDVDVNELTDEAVMLLGWWRGQREKHIRNIEGALAHEIPFDELHDQAAMAGLAWAAEKQILRNDREADLAEFGEGAWFWFGGEGFSWDGDLLLTVGVDGFNAMAAEHRAAVAATSPIKDFENNLIGKPSIVRIVERCATLARCLELGGNVPEPLWFACLSITEHSTPNASFEFSDGYPNFRAEELAEKVARIHQENRKPATCAHLRGLSFDTCKGCGWEIHSPMALGYEFPPKARKGGAE